MVPSQTDDGEIQMSEDAEVGGTINDSDGSDAGTGSEDGEYPDAGDKSDNGQNRHQCRGSGQHT